MGITGFAAGISANTSTLPASSKASSPPFTIATWIQPNAIGSVLNIVGWGYAASAVDRHQLYLNATGQAVAETVATATGSATGTTVLTASKFAHVAGVWSASNAREVFVNGVSEATNTTNLTPAAISFLRVGRQADATDANQFNGIIDSIAVWSSSLTAAEIKRLAEGADPRSISPVTLEMLYLFDSGVNQHNQRNVARIPHISSAMDLFRLYGSSMKHSDLLAPWTRMDVSCGTLSLLRGLGSFEEREGNIQYRREDFGNLATLTVVWEASSRGDIRGTLPDMSGFDLYSVSSVSDAGVPYDVSLCDSRRVDYWNSVLVKMNPNGDYRAFGYPLPMGQSRGMKQSSPLELTVKTSNARSNGRMKFILVKNIS